jgi:MFS superfamily sulfate permease-like transporter
VRRNPGRDLLAGLTVAIVALPLALAFGARVGSGSRGGTGHRGGRGHRRGRVRRLQRADLRPYRRDDRGADSRRPPPRHFRAIARTAVNKRAGASSRLAAVTHSLILLAAISAAAPLVSGIPLAALAGVLFATCVRMVEAGSIRTLMRSNRSDAVVVALTFTVTVAFDLVTAVAVGVGLAIILALRAVARGRRGLSEVGAVPTVAPGARTKRGTGVTSDQPGSDSPRDARTWTFPAS